MFVRAHKSTDNFSSYAATIGDALTEAASTLGAARKALLDKADQVDSGPLNVSEGWVVLIDPGAQTAEQIKDLLRIAASEQAAINALLVAVGDADNAIADGLLSAAKPFGLTPPTTGGLPGMMVLGAQRPADDVPSPRDPVGLVQQATVRGEEMATTVRATQSGYDDEGHFEKTLIMQDGSKIRITEYEGDYDRGVPDMTVEDHFDAEGNLISWTKSVRTGDHRRTTMNFADGTTDVVESTPDGVINAAFTLPDGTEVTVPRDSPLLTQVPDRIGDVLTGVDYHVDRGGGVPFVSMDKVEKLGAGVKYGGVALGTMSFMYDFLRAPTSVDKCVTVFASTFGIAGSAVGGAAFGAAESAIPGAGVVAGPVLAAGGSYLGGKWMSSVGTKVGEALCGA